MKVKNYITYTLDREKKDSLIKKYSDRLDWVAISCSDKLSSDFVEKYSNKLDWEVYSQSRWPSDISTDEFLKKFGKYLCWYCISNNPGEIPDNILEEKTLHLMDINELITKRQLSTKIIEKHLKDINWEVLSEYQFLSPSFVDKYSDKINWDKLSINYSINQTVADKYADKLDWYNVFTHDIYPDLFIREHIDCIKNDQCLERVLAMQKLSIDTIKMLIGKYKFNPNNWKLLTIMQNLSESFLEEYSDYISWPDVNTYNLSEKFIEKNISKFPNGFDHIFIAKTNLSEDFIEKHLKELKSPMKVSSSQLSDEFIDKNSDNINWYVTSGLMNINFNLLDKYSDKIDRFPKVISNCNNIPDWFVEKYSDKIIWNEMTNTNISESAIEKFSDRVNWNFINNPTIDFMERNQDKIAWEHMINSIIY